MEVKANNIVEHRRYDAANEKLTYCCWMMKPKQRCNESELAALSVEGKGDKRTFTSQKLNGSDTAEKEKRLILCFRCGKNNHTSKECTSRAFLCYNCKELTTNPNHTAKTCHKLRKTGPNRVSSRYRRSRCRFVGRGGRFSIRPNSRYLGYICDSSVSQTRGSRGNNLYKRIKIQVGEKPKYAYLLCTY